MKDNNLHKLAELLAMAAGFNQALDVIGYIGDNMNSLSYEDQAVVIDGFAKLAYTLLPIYEKLKEGEK